MNNENWASIVGYEGLYEISDLARVQRIAGGTGARPGNIRIQRTSNSGYSQISLFKNGRVKNCLVHRLVLEAFIGPCPEGMEACHNNGDKLDNRLENLRWDTHQANVGDRIKHGTQARGERQGNSKLTADDVREIRRLRKEGMKLQDIGERFGITKTQVSNIVRFRSWTHI